jgi:hypothetical protein
MLLLMLVKHLLLLLLLLLLRILHKILLQWLGLSGGQSRATCTILHPNHRSI